MATQICLSLNGAETYGDLEYYSGCFYDGNPFFYEKLNPGEAYDLRNIVSMVRLMTDPYAEAYRLSNDKFHFYNLLADTVVIIVIKWVFFVSSIIFVG